MNLDEKETISIFQKSYGNWQEIVDFLKLCKPELHVWALSLLESIKKDLRDTRSEILTDHLLNAAPYPAAIEGEEAQFYSAYILSGRISNDDAPMERLSPGAVYDEVSKVLKVISRF